MGTGIFDLIEFTYRLHILFDPYIQMETKRKEEIRRRLKMLQTELMVSCHTLYIKNITDLVF